MKQFIVCISLAVLGMGAVRAEALTPIYVSTSGSNANNGLTWATAKKTVQAGLNTATTANEVWVAAGMYVERITLKGGVNLFGGFAGGETNRSQRIPGANRTIVSGTGLSGSVLRLVAAGSIAVRVDSLTIRDGYGYSGGGIYCENSSLVMVDCSVEQNRAYDSDGLPLDPPLRSFGGGLCCLDSSLQMIRCVVRGNRAGNGADMVGGPFGDGLSGGDGGGLYLLNGNAMLVDCVVAGNVAGNGGDGADGQMGYGSGGQGGSGGGVWCYNHNLTLVNCVVANNSFGSGGMGGCSWATGQCGGVAPDGSGGGVYGSATIRNSIIWNNAIGWWQYWGSPTVTYSDIQGGWSGVGNINANPLFVDAANGDFRLQANSPCIDAGDNTVVPADTLDIDGDGDTAEPFPTDLAGAPRFANILGIPDTGNGTAPIVDMGAYESVNPFADCNGNGTPDNLELPRLLVADKGLSAVVAYDGWTGQSAGTVLSSVSYPNSVAWGLPNNLFVSEVGANRIIQVAGAVADAAHTSYISGGGLGAPVGAVARSANSLLIASYGTNSVIEYNPTTGAAVRTLVASGSGGLSGPAGMLLTPDGHLLVSSQTSDRVLEYDGQTGAFLRVAAQGSGLDAPAGLVLDGQGNLLVASFATSSVLRFAPDGTFLGAFVTAGSGGLSGAEGIAWGPNGNLFVCSRFTGAILEFSGADGSPIDHDAATAGIQATFASGGAGSQPTYLAFVNSSSDCNRNGIPDGCEPDADGDSVPDACDTCPNTVPGAAVDEHGCPAVIRGDVDRDGDVDGSDLAAFSVCVSGPAVPLVGNCGMWDFDEDTDVDQEDFGLLQRCFSGENSPADPACSE